MKFKLYDKVAVRGSIYKGKVIGTASYSLEDKLAVAYVVQLEEYFQDPTKTIYVAALIAQEKELALIP